MDQQNLSQMHAQLGETLDSKSLIVSITSVSVPLKKIVRMRLFLTIITFISENARSGLKTLKTRMSDEEGGGTTGWLLGVVRK